MASANHSKISRSYLIAIIIVVLITVGAVLASIFIEPDEGPPAPTLATTAPEELPPWYATDGPNDDIDATEPSGTVPDNPDSTEPSGTQPTTPPAPDDPEKPEPSKLSCDRIVSFSGKFVEDGSDVPVENVAALLVTNHSDQFLDLANIVYEIDGEKATFIVTGLPAGKSAWVAEYSKLKISSESKLQYVGCSTSFREGVTATSDDVKIKCDGNLLYATNHTDHTLDNVFIYYKSVNSDGNYFGGITYMVEFGSIEPGKTVEKLGGHFINGESEIIRIGWQESS